jgi:glutamate synthase (NADPH/NADH) small chain
MGELEAFLKIHRAKAPYRDAEKRRHDYEEILGVLPEHVLAEQGARCMDCGVPFCHNGCPLGNLIPDWNDLVYRGDWREAIAALHATNNFPELTGRICPAPCESACVLDINDDPVTIKSIEHAIAERAFDEGWIVPDVPAPELRTGRSVAVVGAGPAGMAAAAELNLLGHHVVVYERDEGVGGLMRFGVPDAKLDKAIIDRRVAILEAEGVEFRCGVDVGVDLEIGALRESHDAVVIAIGAREGREMTVSGRGLRGVHMAMDYLYQRNRAVARMYGRAAPPEPGSDDLITAASKRVLVIGGGDTGMDCISNAVREGAVSAEILDVYPELDQLTGRDARHPWPLAPRRTLNTYALEEGGERVWSTEVTELLDDSTGAVAGVRGRKVMGTSSADLEPVPGSEFEQPAELVLLAIGFTGVERAGFVERLGVELDRRGNIADRSYRTSMENVFVAGDARMGATLIVHAIAEGRRCARVVDSALAPDARRAPVPVAAAGADGPEATDPAEDGDAPPDGVLA